MDCRLNSTIRDEINRKKYLTGFEAIDLGRRNVNKEEGSLEPCRWTLSQYDDGKDDSAPHRNYVYVGEINSPMILSMSVEQMLNSLVRSGLKITFVTGKFELSIFHDPCESSTVVAIEDSACLWDDWETFDEYRYAEKEFIDTLLTQLREEF